MTDSIALTGIEVYARHGVLDHEASHPQPFIIDVTLGVDLRTAGETDRVDATIDYGELAHLIHDTVASERWQLIERVAERVAQVVLGYDACAHVEVTVHKPQAPIGLRFDDVSVTIVRSR